MPLYQTLEDVAVVLSAPACGPCARSLHPLLGWKKSKVSDADNIRLTTSEAAAAGAPTGTDTFLLRSIVALMT